MKLRLVIIGGNGGDNFDISISRIERSSARGRDRDQDRDHDRDRDHLSVPIRDAGPIRRDAADMRACIMPSITEYFIYNAAEIYSTPLL